MIPNFKKRSVYNPSSNPLEGLNKTEQEQFAFEYMQMWINTKRFDDFTIMFESGDAELMADALVSAGAVDSKCCYTSCIEIERIIEGWAKTFRKLTPEQRQARLNVAFKDCTVVRCQDCKLVQFLKPSNFIIYEDQLRESCWECGSINVKVRQLNEK